MKKEPKAHQTGQDTNAPFVRFNHTFCDLTWKLMCPVWEQLLLVYVDIQKYKGLNSVEMLLADWTNQYTWTNNTPKVTRKSITCYYMLYKGVATCYLNLLVISSCCFDTNSEFTEMFLMIYLYQIAQLITNGHYIFKQLSESVAQIMSQKMFLITP